MKTIKRIVSAFLVLLLCFTGTGMPEAFSGLGTLIPGKMVSYAASSSVASSSISGGSGYSFVVSTESDIKAPDYYTRVGNNKAYYTDRDGNTAYRVYGTPEDGETGWYVADENYVADNFGTDYQKVGDEDEYMYLAPIEYSIKGQAESLTGDVLKKFLDDDENTDFKDPLKDELASEYEMVWDDTYNAPYLKTDHDNVYKAKGAFALKRKADGEKAIYYIAYGQRKNNNGISEDDHWFMFEENTGEVKYQFTYKAGSLQRTLHGAVDSTGTVIQPPVDLVGYQKPEAHTLTGNGETWEFAYTANTARLAVYSYDASGDKTTDLVYDEETEIANENQAKHDGYSLKYYQYPYPAE